MAKFLITASLYGSYLYYTDTDFAGIYKEDSEKAEQAELQAYQDFLNCLKKVKTPTTEAQQKGLLFEHTVEQLTNGIERIEGINPETYVDGILSLPSGNFLSDEEYEAAKIAANILGNGGIWQQKLSKETDNYLFYGYSDYIRQNTIYDLKRTSSYDEGKYLKSIQHLLYLECAEGLEHFKYVIAAGKGTPNIYVEDYHKEKNNLELLLSRVDTMVGFIKSVPEFYEPFKANWTAKG